MNNKHWLNLPFSLALLASGPTSAAEQLYTEQPSVTPALAVSGDYAVGVRTLTIGGEEDNAGDAAPRKLVLEIWYPADGDGNAPLATYPNVTRSHAPFEVLGSSYRDVEPATAMDGFPLVVLSHGYTGYRTIMFYLGEHLASHGYVVAAIDHTDSTNAEIDMQNAPGAGFISTLLNRTRDQQQVLEYFARSGSPLTAMTNSNAAAVIGFSMGGYGAINTVGGCYRFNIAGLALLGANAEQAEGLLPKLNICNAGRETVDPRWRAMVAFAPWGGELNVHEASSMANIKVPTLYVAGEEDDISGYDNGVKKLFEQSGSENSYMLVYENARHNIAAHPAPSAAFDSDLDIGHHYEPAWDLEIINRVNKHMTLAFLDCHVRERKDACEFLPLTQDVTQIKDKTGTLSAAWPGFPERWGTGLLFYRKDTLSPD